MIGVTIGNTAHSRLCCLCWEIGRRASSVRLIINSRTTTGQRYEDGVRSKQQFPIPLFSCDQASVPEYGRGRRRPGTLILEQPRAKHPQRYRLNLLGFPRPVNHSARVKSQTLMDRFGLGLRPAFDHSPVGQRQGFAAIPIVRQSKYAAYRS